MTSRESSWQCDCEDGVEAVPAQGPPLRLQREPQPRERRGRGYRSGVSGRQRLGAAGEEEAAHPARRQGCLAAASSAGAQ